ncbi:MAG: DUF861 domain-containing protein [Chloroflexi bacterium]|nr:DUF861 domain-containing protein [Chloroflexota bacterium]
MSIKLYKVAEKVGTGEWKFPVEKHRLYDTLFKGSDFRFKDFVTAKDSWGMCTAGVGTLTKGEFDWDWKYDQVIFVLQGEMVIEDKDAKKVFSAKPGDIYMCSRGTRTRIRGVWTVFYVTMPPWEFLYP